MKRRLSKLVLAVGVIMTLAIPVGAAELHGPHQGLDCKGSTLSTLHFVNNQTGGLDGIYLWVETSGGTIGPLPPADSRSRNNHWRVTTATGDTLINAWTTVGNDGPSRPLDADGPGKLVLSSGKCKGGGSIFDD